MTHTSSEGGTPPNLLRPRLSPVIKSASDASMAAQRTMLWATRLELAFVIAAAVGGATLSLGLQDPGAVLTVGGLLGAILATGYITRTRPEREWYDGRAVAESCKTLAWRYAVRGRPFGPDETDPRAVDEAFDRSLREVTTALGFAAPEVGAGPAITDDMRSLRAASLAVRREAYETGRITDQQDWYAAKARDNEDRASRWKKLVFGLELAGLAAGIGLVANVYAFDAIGVIAASAAAATAWLQLKQHESLARAYAIASTELSSIRSLIVHQGTDETWSDFVDQSEEAISREHTLWRASRGVATPTGLARPAAPGR